MKSYLQPIPLHTKTEPKRISPSKIHPDIFSRASLVLVDGTSFFQHQTTSNRGILPQKKEDQKDSIDRTQKEPVLPTLSEARGTRVS